MASMKPEVERPVAALASTSPAPFRDDRREMPACSSTLTTVRKEVRGVAVRTASHVIDRVVWNTGAPELESNQGGEIAMHRCASHASDGAALPRAFHLARNLWPDLERLDANVRTDRDHELCRIERERLDGSRHDPGHRAPPTRVNGSNVSARRVRDQHWDAIGRARCDCEALDAGDQAISFVVSSRHREIGPRDLAHVSPVHLPLLEETVDRESEALCESSSVLPDGDVLIAQMKTEVQRVVRCDAHPTRPQCKRMAKAVPPEKDRMQTGHVDRVACRDCAGRRSQLSRPAASPGRELAGVSISF